jgi:hypothetical protein
MRLCHFVAAGLSLPLFVVPVFAQSTQQPAGSTAQQPAPSVAEQTTPEQQSTPSQQAAPAPLQLHDLSPEPHTPTPQELAAQKAERLRMALTRLADMQANWGPPESAPGMSLELKETARSTTAAGTEITYQMTSKGFTPDMQLTLVRWPLGQKITEVMSGIVMNAAGTAVCGIAAPGPPAPTDSSPSAAANQAPSCTKLMKPGTPIAITTTAAKGEAVRVALIAADHKHGAAVSLVPFPIEAASNGCRLQVILGSRDAGLVLIEGDGFKQDKTYTLGTETFGEKHAVIATIDPKGHFAAALTPWVPGHDTGDTVIYYQSTTCTPTISFHWGKGTYKPEQ